MTDYLLDTNIILRTVQPQAPTHGIIHLLTFNVDDFQRYADITVVHPNKLVP